MGQQEENAEPIEPNIKSILPAASFANLQGSFVGASPRRFSKQDDYGKSSLLKRQRIARIKMLSGDSSPVHPQFGAAMIGEISSRWIWGHGWPAKRPPVTR
jgi:hypothetical protein